MTNQESWTQFNSNIVTRSQRARAKAKEYRDLIDQMLCMTASEMTNQWNIVNAAFSERIREYMKARTDLETHLAKVSAMSCFDVNPLIDAHCCRMGTGIKHPVPDRVKP